MFRGIGENPPDNTGKKCGESTLHGKATHFTLGDEVGLAGAESSTKMQFTGYLDQKLVRTKPCPKPVSQIVMGDTPVTYMSNAKTSFQGPPNNYKKVKPTREKHD